MAQTITLKQSEYKRLIDRITKLEKMFSRFISQIKNNPEYGSDEWWNKELTIAEAELKSGKGKLFDSSEELVEYLKSIAHAN